MAARHPLNKSQLETLRKRLEDERKRVLRVLQGTRPEETPADALSEVEETAQRATEWTQQRGVAERERALLAEVDRALAKFAAGTYGISEKTGAPIPYDRLSAVPWARQGTDE
ncbi:MAG TPA: TraR/DksA family transcriptional regulator [Myxococcales bacterium]|nr:TraR/DksA family transcriptional regulator [Myxococcales bacterium]